MAQQFYCPLQLNSTLTVGVNDTGHDVQFFGATAGKNLLWDESADRLIFADTTYLALGSDSDMVMYHTDTHGYIVNQKGRLIIQNSADDEDIIFKCDDGSGGNATYLTLDGSAKTIEVSVPINVGVDDTGHDVKFFGATAGSYWQWDESANGVVQIGTLQVGVDDAGHDVRFFGATAGRHMLWDESADTLLLTDRVALKFGTGGDFSISHNGTDVAMNEGTGDFTINNAANDKDIIFTGIDNSSQITALTLDMSAAGAATFNDKVVATELDISGNCDIDGTTNLDAVDIDGAVDCDGALSMGNTITVGVDGTGHDVKFFGATAGSYMLWDESADSLILTDSTPLKIGDSGDLVIQHNGSDSIIENEVGDLYIRNDANDKDIVFQSDNGSGNMVTYFLLNGSQGSDPGAGETIFPDYSKLMLGNGGDMNLYHTGSHSYITNATGGLFIATLTSGVPVSIGHVTSETTVNDNLNVTGIIDVNGGITLEAMTPPSAPANSHAVIYVDNETGALTAQVTGAEGGTTTCVLCAAGEG